MMAICTPMNGFQVASNGRPEKVHFWGVKFSDGQGHSVQPSTYNPRQGREVQRKETDDRV